MMHIFVNLFCNKATYDLQLAWSVKILCMKNWLLYSILDNDCNLEFVKKIVLDMHYLIS